MGAVTPAVDPSNITQALVYTLLHALDETRDLIHTLNSKDKRDRKESHRAKGYAALGHVEDVDGQGIGSDERIVMEKAAVTRQFETGYQEHGAKFAVGDVVSHTALQSQIITLQGMLIATFLYGPTSSRSITTQVSNLIAASRTAGDASIRILAAQIQRQNSSSPQDPSLLHSSSSGVHPSKRSPCDPIGGPMSTSLVRYQGSPRIIRTGSPVNTTVLQWRGQPKLEGTDTDNTSVIGPTSHVIKPAPQNLYCPYAIDLQRHPSQQLSMNITSNSVPNCPNCKRTMHLSPGRAWELRKEDDGFERVFQVSNRFVVKCHRDGADGQYSCVLCSKHGDVVSICGDVKALIRHVWDEHSIAQLKHEEDITELIDLQVDKRRDSGLGQSAYRNSRRSVSVGPSRRRSRHGYES